MIPAIYERLSRFLQSKRPGFHHGTCRFIAGSDASGSISFEQKLFTEKNEEVEYILDGFSDLVDEVRVYFLNNNDKEKRNLLEFNFTSPSEYTYKYYWDQAVQDDFEQYLPKSKQGKIIPWYAPESEFRKILAAKKTAQTEKLNSEKSWKPIGEFLEEFEIPYLNPIHHGYPQWASDRYLQLWRTHWNTYIVCTQGLHSEQGENSLNLELYLETVEQPENFSSSWQANIVYELGKLLPKVNDLKERFDTYKYISVQIGMEGAPEEWSLQEHDNIGVLLGIEHDEFKKRNLQFPFRPLNCKLLRPAEVKLIKKLNTQGREKLVNFFKQKDNGTVSSLTRPSAVKDE